VCDLTMHFRGRTVKQARDHAHLVRFSDEIPLETSRVMNLRRSVSKGEDVSGSSSAVALLKMIERQTGVRNIAPARSSVTQQRSETGRCVSGAERSLPGSIIPRFDV